MDGAFTSGRYHFQVEPTDWLADLERGFCEDVEDGAFDLRLTNTGKIPDLGGAPIASWLLARLARLTDDGLALGGRQDNDGGGYLIEFVVYRRYSEWEDPQATCVQPLLFDPAESDVDDEPVKAVASVQFQGDMEGVAVIGQRDPGYSSEQVLEAFAAALLAAPTELSGCELAVKDPEWKLDPEMYRPRPAKGSRNWYGWDGYQFLGKDNIREADLST